MSLAFTARRFAETALRKIAAFSINDTGADPVEVREALVWLDMLIASLAGTRKLFWLVQTDIVVALTANTSSYDIIDEMGADAPADGVLAYTHVSLRDSNGNDIPLKMLTRTEYEDIENKTETGTPWGVYIDRIDPVTLYVLGVPTTTDFSLVITTLAYPQDMTVRLGGEGSGIPPEWNSYVVIKLSSYIGNGPVRQLPLSEVQDMRGEAEDLKVQLLAFGNREQRGPRARRTQAY
jgi:hypothetical protein